MLEAIGVQCLPVLSLYLITRRQALHMKGQKLDTLEQLQIYKHTKTQGNNVLNEQMQFKSHILFENTLVYITMILQTAWPSSKSGWTVLPVAASDEAHNERKLIQAMG